MYVTYFSELSDIVFDLTEDVKKKSWQKRHVYTYDRSLHYRKKTNKCAIVSINWALRQQKDISSLRNKSKIFNLVYWADFKKKNTYFMANNWFVPGSDLSSSISSSSRKCVLLRDRGRNQQKTKPPT